ncbi:MAG TPA: prepilin-type N-terminal cleavage/methylation domain-containing protein, partial [Kiritimatiellia bacterium]|nr:prepilin-type N-terminal cleavage/methylation domain-containing protein [Kiritimatiellia bacterium]
SLHPSTLPPPPPSAFSFHPSSLPPAPRAASKGFSLIELLIVIVITTLLATIALPSFVRATSGSQLRAATRTVVMAHKYARSTAVLRQTPMALLFDRVGGELEVVSMVDRSSLASRDRFLDTRTRRTADALTGAETVEQTATDISSELVRRFGRDVKITGFRTSRDDQFLEGYHWVTYFPNGMSDGFELRLEDTGGRAVTIEAEPISGAIETEFSRW